MTIDELLNEAKIDFGIGENPRKPPPQQPAEYVNSRRLVTVSHNSCLIMFGIVSVPTTY